MRGYSDGMAMDAAHEIHELRKTVEGMTDAMRSVARHVQRAGGAQGEALLPPDQCGLQVEAEVDFRLETAIELTARLIGECGGDVRLRLSAHLEQLLQAHLHNATDPA